MKEDDRRIEGRDYEKPEIADYGSLRELTQAGSMPNGDVPHGVDNAYS